MAAIRSAVTVSLVPQARGGPFVFWDDLEAACQRASQLGFDGIELFPPAADAVSRSRLAQLLEDNELQLAAVGTGGGWVVERLTLTATDAARRRRASRFVGEIIDFAAAFGAPAIIGSMQGRSDAELSREQALDYLRQSLDELGEHAGRCGVPLLLEPLNRYETNLINTIDQAVALIGSLATTHVRLLADLFHMNIEEVDLAAALRAGAPHIGHLHFADSNRQAAGRGHTDFGPLAAALVETGYSGYISAEVLPLPTSDEAARQTMESFRRFFGGEKNAQ